MRTKSRIDCQHHALLACSQSKIAAGADNRESGRTRRHLTTEADHLGQAWPVDQIDGLADGGIPGHAVAVPTRPR